MLNLSLASDNNGRSQWPRCLMHGSTWLAFRESRFESHRGHGCLSHVSVEYCLCVGLITRRQESYSGANLPDNMFIVFQYVAVNFLATRNTNRT